MEIVTKTKFSSEYENVDNITKDGSIFILQEDEKSGKPVFYLVPIWGNVKDFTYGNSQIPAFKLDSFGCRVKFLDRKTQARKVEAELHIVL